MPHDYLFMVLLFLVALLYSSVGHGGGSGYLALFSLWGVSNDLSRPMALMLNLVVSIIAFIPFYKRGHFSWQLFLPLIIPSIPFAYLGGLTPLKDELYKIILAVILILTALRLLFHVKDTIERRTPNVYVLILLGGSIGYISGLMGIGGGIILSPFLLLMSWSDVKTTAGISALFIFLNSVAGLLARKQLGISLDEHFMFILFIALAGSALGSTFGAAHFNKLLLRKLLALGLFIAAFKLLLPSIPKNKTAQMNGLIWDEKKELS